MCACHLLDKNVWKFAECDTSNKKKGLLWLYLLMPEESSHHKCLTFLQEMFSACLLSLLTISCNRKTIFPVGMCHDPSQISK